MLRVQLNVPNAPRVHVSALTVPIDRYPQGYEAGYAEGKESGTSEGYTAGQTAANREHQFEKDRLLFEINTILTMYGVDTASDLHSVDRQIPYVYDKAFEQGFTKGLHDGTAQERDRFWDSVLMKGARTDYNCAFRYWSDTEFHPKYKVMPGGTSNSAYAMLQHMVNLKKAEAAYIDLSNVTDTSSSSYAYALFGGCSALEEVEDIGLHAGLHYHYTFYKCARLHSIAKLRSSASTKWTYTFSECPSIVNLNIEGEIGQSGIDLHWSTKLSRTSIENVIAALSASASGKSITLSKTAVNAAFETRAGAADGNTSASWLALRGTKSNWTISLV